MKEGLDLSQQRVLAIRCEHNAHGKKDVTYAFKPEARDFVKLAAEGSRVVIIDNHKKLSGRRAQCNAILDGAIEAGEHFDSVAVFCHGWLNGIQIGYTRKTVNQLSQRIFALTGESSVVTVPLFCCSTGEDPEDDPLNAAGTGDDSFADKLRDDLCGLGANLCRVMAHTTVAHTTSNPMVLFMDGMGTPDGGVGGYPPVAQGSASWKAWKKALRDRKNNTLRFRMPYMSVAAIHEEIG
jgi:hypothetical protein